MVRFSEKRFYAFLISSDYCSESRRLKLFLNAGNICSARNVLLFDRNYLDFKLLLSVGAAYLLETEAIIAS